MTNKRYILLIETSQEVVPHNITISENQVISLMSLFYSLKGLFNRCLAETETRQGKCLQALFGEGIFSYNGVSLFDLWVESNNATCFVKQSFNGHMSSAKEVIPVLSLFVDVRNQQRTIERTYTHLENTYKNIPPNELKQQYNELKRLIASWREKIKEYNDLNVSFPYEKADDILDCIDKLSPHIEDYRACGQVVTAMGYFAICFLSLTETAYSNRLNAKESEKRTFKAVQSALSELLKSIKKFLEEPRPKDKTDGDSTAEVVSRNNDEVMRKIRSFVEKRFRYWRELNLDSTTDLNTIDDEIKVFTGKLMAEGYVFDDDTIENMVKQLLKVYKAIASCLCVYEHIAAEKLAFIFMEKVMKYRDKESKQNKSIVQEQSKDFDSSREM